ncbi:hypothetical protein Pla175_48280 [Pirellulimonas nuda]|uniref:Uncharacterized protein n=1 Tax=Pirellulimonas nuda TaxID=2528009 RepID=A0A518DIU8_9BACT|nr:hypothetical protein [Pirellulimonas nuda]QDU91405.1 hypothetical protein Pla175_48280 [Pirellulimonas nuda]
MQARTALSLFFALCAAGAAAQGPRGEYTNRLIWGNEVADWRNFVDTTAQPRPGLSVRAATPMPVGAAALPAGPAPLTRQTENALNYFGSARARATLAQIPQPPTTATMQAAPPQRRGGSKPFAGAPGASSSPVISPYLNLDRSEDASQLPNYYTFVRPQLDQESINQKQQYQLGRLQQQVKQASYVSPGGGAGAPGTGHTTRFGNTGRYYQK